MKCPYCGTKLDVGQIECPHCISHGTAFHDPAPIAPGSASGGALFGMAAGLAVAAAGALLWAWLVELTRTIHTWPAVLLGTAIGVAVRLTAGDNPTTRSLIGLVCGVAGIGGGVALIAYATGFDLDRLGGALSVANLAFLFVGLSLAKSISSGKIKSQPIN